MTIQISLLGPPEIKLDEEVLHLPGYRPLALLAYLLLTATPQSRNHLSNLLFDRPADPRAALRWTVFQLRKIIGEPLILADRHEITFNFATDHWLDISAFEGGDLALYRGELLEGIDLRGAHQYEAWLLVERERLRGLYQAGLERRLEDEQAVDDAAAVENTAITLLQLDDLRQDWHRVLMKTYADQGKFDAALAQYAQCVHNLHQELGMAPAPETESLAAAIEQRQTSFYHLVAKDSQPPLQPVKSINTSTAQAEIVSSTNPATNLIEKNPRALSSRMTLGVAMLLMVLLALIGLNGNQGALWQERVGSREGQSAPFANNLKGTHVTLGTLLDPGYFENQWAQFEKETGITIEIIQYHDDYEQIIPGVIESGLKPDIALIPQPGLVADLVRQGEVVDVRAFLDDGYLRSHYSDALLQAATIEGQMAGVWSSYQVKSLVWYPRRAFDAAGYEVPQTWEELMALSAQIAADGTTPWCIGIEHGAASGWIGTDWIENILLRTAPAELYDAWVAGKLPFVSAEINSAFQIMGQIWLEDQFVYGGRASINATPTFSHSPLFEEPPGCYLNVQGSFAPALFPDNAVDGQDYDVFYLPPIDSQFGKPVLGSGDLAVMLNDRPEVRAVMRFLATADSVRDLVEAGIFISPHKDARLEWYASPSQLKIAQILLQADTFRFDASDLMPPEVGTGSFWQGIVEWTEGHPLDQVLQDIDTSWPEQDR